MKHLVPALCVASLSLWQIHGAEQTGTPRLDRTNLLEYHDAKGAVRPVKSAADWQKRRAEILKGMQEVMGPLPGKEKRCPLDVRVDEEADGGIYVRRSVTYAPEPNSRVPAYLLIPKEALNGKKKFPAVLCLHPTEKNLGNKVVVGLGGKPNRDYARELAERGYVTIAPAYPWLANYEPDLKGLGYESGTMKAIWDNVRALDLLDSLTYVKKGQYGVIGHSLGGHNSVYTALFDDRIKAIVTSSGLDSYLDYYGGNPKFWEFGQGWCQTRYMPKMANYKGRLQDIPFDFHEMIGALAPRHCFINAPLQDSNFKWQSVDEVVKAASQIYKLYGVPGHLRVEHPDCLHDFPNEMREMAYKLFDEVLR